MNDVLPKPFTKEGLLTVLEKHLIHLKSSHPESMGHPGQPLSMASTRQSLKEDDSPGKSPATASNWNSPGQLTGVSPVASDAADNYMGQSGGYHPHNMYGNPMPAQRPQQQNSIAGHRRQISDMSGPGGPEMSDQKRQMFGNPMQHQQMNQMQRPR